MLCVLAPTIAPGRLETDRGTVLVGAEPTEELLDALTR